MRARVHAQGAADRAGHAAQESEAVDAGVGGRARNLGVERGGAGDDAKSGPCLDRAEGAAAEPDHHAGNAAVAHDEVRADADDEHGNFTWQAGEEGGKVVLVGRREQGLSRAADAEPGVGREWDVKGDFAARVSAAPDRIGVHDARRVPVGRRGEGGRGGGGRRGGWGGFLWGVAGGVGGGGGAMGLFFAFARHTPRFSALSRRGGGGPSLPLSHPPPHASSASSPGSA